MSKRGFRERRSTDARYPTLRGFLASHRRTIAGVGLCLLASGALTGCLWTTMGEAALPPSLADARVERTVDGGSDALRTETMPAGDQQPGRDQQPGSEQISR